MGREYLTKLKFLERFIIQLWGARTPTLYICEERGDNIINRQDFKALKAEGTLLFCRECIENLGPTLI